MNEETNTGHDRQHGQRQTIQRQIHLHVEVADMHPGPERLRVGLLTVGEEVKTDHRRGQGRQTHGSHTNRGRQVL